MNVASKRLDSIPFLSDEPDVRIVNAFERPFENAVATARTCYSSSGVITVADVSGDQEPDPLVREKKAQRRDALARSIYEAAHHTTLQHAHFQFALSNVSRQFLWTFLHSHPFYNSEQVSQRYVEVKPGSVAVPPLSGEALSLYERTVDRQVAAYQRLIERLTPPIADAYFARFPSRRSKPKYVKEVKKKAQEIARYVLPIGTFAYLYHTVSGLTLLRYWRVCNQLDAPTETRIVVGKMVAQMLEHDPLYRTILEEPMPIEETPEYAFVQSLGEDRRAASTFRDEFDRDLGGRVSKLVDWKARGEESLADAVREIFALPSSALSDDDAIALALDPSRNNYFGEAMNLTTLTKLSRALHHPAYTFKKKLSHTGDSQDQRHRMTPASRPCLTAHVTGEPDFVEPEIVRASSEAFRLYRETMEISFDAFREMRRLGAPTEFALYVLPNALSIRFTESSDLLNLHHKIKSRLCYNAQEEIWRASLDEAEQIAAVNPRIGKFLLPPCGLRILAKTAPWCPEGDRYCGVPVWKLERRDYVRTI
ncbi:MAG: FAD-dependent thymidylate synthase [Planctomycetes bacterium]|nr:FAD-dependent thymidylate synthase [Planctomycetota bacterium]MBI3846460.1 FAD-dependent thymidylate synthase [Planctomycetota bacterium]